MIGAFYNQNSLKDTLILNINDSKPASIKNESGYCIGFDEKNKICFINIFNFSKYLQTDKIFLKYDNKINEIIAKVCNVDLSEYINDNGFVVAEVLECEDIEGTHLHKCKVFDGKNKLDIVCGAKNVRVGLKTVLATDNSILPNGVRIKPGKVLGNFSQGMLCSCKELNINNKKFNDIGIIELDANYKVGDKFNEIYL